MAENNAKKIRRLITIVVLLANKRGAEGMSALNIKEAVDLALDENVPLRSIQRDLLDLSDIPNLNIVHEGSRKGGYQYFIEGSVMNLCRNLNFITLDEALAGYMMQRIAPAFRGTKLEEQFTRLMEKVDKVFDSTAYNMLSNRKDYMGDIQFSPFGLYDYSQKKDILSDILRATVEKKTIKLTYASTAGLPRESVRRPLKVLFAKNMVYLFAADEGAQYVSTLRLDRMVRVKVIENGTFDPKQHELDIIRKYEEEGFGVYHKHGEEQKPETVVLQFAPYLADRIKNRSWHSSQTFRDLPDGGIELKMKVLVEEELIGWIFYWQTGVKVVAPASLKKTVRERAKAIAK